MHEFDFLQVTQSEKSGDAIAIRFTRSDNAEMAVIVIDAGYIDFGDILADHIEEHTELAYRPGDQHASRRRSLQRSGSLAGTRDCGRAHDSPPGSPRS